MMITATKVKAIHIPYPTPAPPHTHTGHVHLPSILHNPCGGYPPLGPTAPPQWRDAHYKRLREGPSSHPTPHRQTRLDSPPPPHTHRLYIVQGDTGHTEGGCPGHGDGEEQVRLRPIVTGHLIVGKWKICKL